jgi:hypothetical protein
MTTVLVSGAVANKHRQGGSVWVRMSWAEGLRALGFDVVFVEEIDEETCVDEAGGRSSFEASANAAAFDAVMAEFGFAGSAALVESRSGRVRGLAREDLLARTADAVLLVNLGGHLRWAPLRDRMRRAAYVDLDPGYTQIWAAEGRDLGLHGHDLHFTVGANVGTARCPLPTGGLAWRPIRQPVVLDRWPVANGGFSRFTTVASWRGAFGPLRFAGRTLGPKAHEFRRLADVPGRTGLPFAAALDIHPADGADRLRLREGGWNLVEPDTVSSPAGFARFVRESGGELSPAQAVYVHTRTGWFSDRTVRYLASGRPALVQDTGFDLPVGEGLLTFSTPQEAGARAQAIVADYDRHAAAARRIAEEHFAHDVALAPLLEAIES